MLLFLFKFIPFEEAKEENSALLYIIKYPVAFSREFGRRMVVSTSAPL